MKKLSVLFFTLTVVLFSCKPSKEKLQQQVTKAEGELFQGDKGQFGIDTAKANTTIAAYEAYAEAFKDDTLSPEYLFRAADLQRSMRKTDKSVALYDRIIAEFPKSSRAPYSLFLKGFMYENETQEIDKAREIYHQFLATYPEHQLADDVAFSLKNLGKTPEELIKQFEQMNQDSLPQ
jgi:outer membrane protein assembly factor BamD (BamD/ComL family)